MSPEGEGNITTVKCRVYLEDTDAGQVVYHANYLKFMERARTEFIRAYGLNRNYMLRQQVIFVVRKMEVFYQAPAHLDDELIATAAIADLHKFAVNFKQQVIREKDGRVLASAKVQVVAIDQRTGKLAKLPPMTPPPEISN